MSSRIPLLATIAAGLLAAGAITLFIFEQYVASGTLFVLTAFAIYIRETNM